MEEVDKCPLPLAPVEELREIKAPISGPLLEVAKEKTKGRTVTRRRRQREKEEEREER